MSNQAAWITEAKAHPFKVGKADYWQPGPNQVLIKNAAVAVNPVDWKVQDSGYFIQKYPNVLGTDVAGEIAEVGEGVTRLRKGQRVIGHCIGLASNEPKEGAFQLYSICPEILVAPIPDNVSFQRAAVLPLSLSTAAAGLYQKSHLALPYPTKDAKPANKTILVWGGSSSVGSSAIQLAVASGLTVVATASKRNHDYVKSLGAEKVFDYADTNVTEDIVSALKDHNFAGIYDSISLPDTIKTCAAISAKLGGGRIATVLPPPEGLPKDVEAVGVFAITIANQEQEVGDAVWRKYVPDALADGRLQAKPDPIVIEGGLSKIQEGVDRQKQGVSAAKIVVAL